MKLTEAATRPAQERALETALEFVGFLRGKGLAIPLGTARLFVEALCEVDFGKPNHVYWAARSVLVSNPEDLQLFNEAFIAFWRHEDLSSFAFDDPSSSARSMTAILMDQRSGKGKDSKGDEPFFTLPYCATDRLGRKNFADYSEAELREAHKLMASAVPMLPVRRSRKQVVSRKNRGRFDLGTTVSRSFRYMAEPVEIAKTTRASKPRRLVFLLDVSGSMEPYSRALIGFVQALVAGGSQVEAFALGTRLTRLTSELSHKNPDHALKAASAAVKDWAGGTRLAEGLSSFNDKWGCRGLSHGAVVVILSDGWDHGTPDEMAKQMGRLSWIAHRVVWVNPLKASPGYAPLAGAMAAALAFVDDFVEGHCLDSLYDLAELVLCGKRTGQSPRHATSVGI